VRYLKVERGFSTAFRHFWTISCVVVPVPMVVEPFLLLFFPPLACPHFSWLANDECWCLFSLQNSIYNFNKKLIACWLISVRRLYFRSLCLLRRFLFGLRRDYRFLFPVLRVYDKPVRGIESAHVLQLGGEFCPFLSFPRFRKHCHVDDTVPCLEWRRCDSPCARFG